MINRILSLLGQGEENSRTREELARILMVDDRTVREEIQLYRSRDLQPPILSNSKVRGYFLPSKERSKGVLEAKRFLSEQQSRSEKNLESTIGALAYIEKGG